MISALESILFAIGDEGLTLIDISNILEIEVDKVTELIDKLNEKYKDENSGIELKILGNKYKLVTKKENKKYLEALSLENSNNLSQTALVTLAIIAYNEPVTRIAVDKIRGNNSSNMIRSLVSKGFVEVAGKSDEPGKPNLYKTTDRFLDYFNLASLDKLPELKEEVEVLDEEIDLFESRYKEGA